MVTQAEPLDLTMDPADLTAALVDIESVSRNEKAIADAVEEALRRQCPAYEVIRDGDAVLARSHRGLRRRALFAGHLDTVPTAENLPSRVEDGRIYGCGTSDMKSGVAVFLHLAATVPDPTHDITLVLYDCEELPPDQNGIGRILTSHPDWLHADVAIVGEPTNGEIEAGCQGTLWAQIDVRGVRAHSARSWLGVNAIHEMTPVLERVRQSPARQVEIDGCTFREGLQVVNISGGVAANVLPDACSITLNFRFAPDRSVEEAVAYVYELFSGLSVTVTILDAEPGALPNLSSDVAHRLIAAADGAFRAKLGWTDVARFAALGIPAVNFGPGDPQQAHVAAEYVETERIESTTRILRDLLTDNSTRAVIAGTTQESLNSD
jgi:succinyl-diaminopimelate desuccinylase